MTNNEVMKMLLKLTEENTRLKTLFDYIKTEAEQRKSDSRSTIEIETLLKILDAGKELNVIKFDNCEDNAYEFKDNK